ncbi:MAG: Rap1a/Tai family immunity protein [Candidatus Binatia bacterium]
MSRNWVSVLFFVIVLNARIAGAVTDEDFEVKTTQNLLNLCTVSASDPKSQQAIHFCHGYLVGAYHYHMAESAGPDGAKRLVCPPQSGGPVRNEAIAMFVEWAKARPQYMKDPPVETEFRFLTEKWPCAKK